MNVEKKQEAAVQIRRQKKRSLSDVAAGKDVCITPLSEVRILTAHSGTGLRLECSALNGTGEARHDRTGGMHSVPPSQHHLRNQYSAPGVDAYVAI